MIKILKYGDVASSEIFARTVPTANVSDVVADIIYIQESLTRLSSIPFL